MTKTDIKTTTYRLNEGYMVDVVDMGMQYAAWFYHNGYGVKMLMFEIDKSNESYESFLDLVKRNIPTEKKVYRELYLDFEEEPA